MRMLELAAEEVLDLLEAQPDRWFYCRDVANEAVMSVSEAALAMGFAAATHKDEVELAMCEETGFYKIRKRNNERVDS